VTVKRRTNLLWGVIALAACAAFLANALGAIPAGIFDLIVRAVPALLIVAGLAFLLRGRVPLGSLFALIIGVAAVGGVATTAFNARVDQVRTDQRVMLDQPIDADVGILRVRIETGGTDVEVTRGEGGRRIGGEFLGSRASVVTVTYSADAGAGTAIIREAQGDGFPLLDSVGRGTMRVELPADVPLDIDFVGGMGALTLNLGGLALERLNIVAPRGDVAVTLPDYAPQLSARGDSLGTLRADAGDLTIFVPASVAARFELNRGDSGIQPIYDAGAYQYLVGDILESFEYRTAAAVARYSVVAPRGEIRIQVSG
jgi:hypothetical protein